LWRDIKQRVHELVDTRQVTPGDGQPTVTDRPTTAGRLLHMHAVKQPFAMAKRVAQQSSSKGR
jgi:hypothetical protein